VPPATASLVLPPPAVAAACALKQTLPLAKSVNEQRLSHSPPVLLAPLPARLLARRACRRLQKDLEKLLERHRDLLTAPSAPTLVRLEVRWAACGQPPPAVLVAACMLATSLLCCRLCGMR
jgi:hypothetical protein